MEFSSFFPVWNRLTAEQQAVLSGGVFGRRVKKGDVIHNGDADCTGLLLVRSGQLRAFILSEDGGRSPSTGCLNAIFVCFLHPA